MTDLGHTVAVISP